MIKDTRNSYISVSTELITDKLIPAGNIDGIPSYYSYKCPSIKSTYSLKYFLQESEINIITTEMFKNAGKGYNSGSNILDTDIPGDVIDLKANNLLYIDENVYYSCDITAVSYPEYDPISTNYAEIIYENQIKIAGFYLDGSVYLDDVGNAGKLIKTKKIVGLDALNDLSVASKSDFGSIGADTYILSATPTDYKYIVSPDSRDLLIEVEIIEITT